MDRWLIVRALLVRGVEAWLGDFGSSSDVEASSNGLVGMWERGFAAERAWSYQSLSPNIFFRPCVHGECLSLEACECVSRESRPMELR